VHSFTGTAEEVDQLLTLHPQVYIGINGCSLKTIDNCNAMSVVPLQRIMLETDAPWCDCRPTHASAEHVVTKLDSVDKKKHSRDMIVKGRNEPCNIAQVRQSCTFGVPSLALSKMRSS
jgi:TatD DNase family protein